MFQGSEPSKRICEAEVDNFFAEIDALGTGPLLSKPNGSPNTKPLHPDPPAPSDSPPPPPPPPPPAPLQPALDLATVICDWTEYVDPQTEYVYYYNVRTQETTWAMPEEYRVKKEGLTGSENSVTQTLKAPSKNSGNAEGEIEYLQEYVANSETSDSSEESSSSDSVHGKTTDSFPTRNEKDRSSYKGFRKRRKSRTKDEDSVISKKQRKHKKPNTDESENVLIGPQLPSAKKEVGSEGSDEAGSQRLINSEIGPQLPNNVTDDEDADGETNRTRFIGPRLPSMDEDTNGKCETALTWKTNDQVDNDSSQFQEAQEELSETIQVQSSMLLSKLQFLNVTMESLPLLSILLIKVETRYSDWSCGALSLERMVSTLNEAIVEMANYESSAVPNGWKCFWDDSTGRYYYENQITNDCQWEYPTEPATSETTDAAVVSPAPESSSSNYPTQELSDKETAQQLEEEPPAVESPAKEAPESGDDGRSNDCPYSSTDTNHSDSREGSEVHSHVTLEEFVCAEETSSGAVESLPADSSLLEAVESDDKLNSSNEVLEVIDEKDVSVNCENPTSEQTPLPPAAAAPAVEPVVEIAAPVQVEEKPSVPKPLRLVAYDDDEDSDSQSEDEDSVSDSGSKTQHESSDQPNSLYAPQTCSAGPESVDRDPNRTQQSLPSSAVSASSGQSSPVTPREPSPCLDGDDMEVDSDNEQASASIVLNVPTVPPPPLPPLPLLPARPPTPPPPPPPPPHRPILTSVPQTRSSQVIIETPPTGVIVEVRAPEAALPSTSELIDEFDEDQSSSAAATKRKKQKPAKSKIGLKGMQNLFQKWQQVQENL